MGKNWYTIQYQNSQGFVNEVDVCEINLETAIAHFRRDYGQEPVLLKVYLSGY